MTLAPGMRLGAHRIVGRLGAGGMGEVWRAHDERLSRDVAIKVLPEALARDADALERFEREARAVAALSHPNILAIHDFGKDDGLAFAVMELLEGETLRDKVEHGPLPPRKAVEYAQQIAHGLAAAHEKGIVHRDLKPENVFVTQDGRVKILDFGLAKADARPKRDDETSAPTATRHTDPGTVMGTVGYMSPEQVKGLPVDHRTDIFSFGAMFYEMLSGARAFRRDTPPETLTAILREEPPELSASSARVDPALDRLVRHCLEKSPAERFQSARDLAYALSSFGASSTPSASGAATTLTRPSLRPRALVGVALGVVLGASIALLLRPRAASSPPTLQVLTYSGSDGEPSASPDGKTIAFMSGRGGVSRIWIKQLAGGAEVAITSGGDSLPRISPDGSTVLFVHEAEGVKGVYRVAIVGGDARKIVGPAEFADWSPDGREIAYVRIESKDGKSTSELRRIALDGTGDRLVARVEERILAIPRWAPGGGTIAALEAPFIGVQSRRIGLFPLDGKPPSWLDSSEVGSGFCWNGDGRGLVMVAGGHIGLSQTTFGARGKQLVLMETPLGRTRALLTAIDLRGFPDVVGRGSLVLAMGGPRASLREVDSKTGRAGRWLTRGSCVDRQPTYSPDGEWVAFTSSRSGNSDVWEVSVKTGGVRRLTDDPAQDFDPFLTRDGKHLVFSSNRSGHFEIWMADRDGSSARQVSNDGRDAENGSAKPDGQWLVYGSGNVEKRGIWKVRADGSSATRLVPGDATLPEISPDGTIVSYVMNSIGSKKSVRFVRLEDGAEIPIEIPAEGGGANTGRHRWMPDGRALAIQVEDADGNRGVVIQDFAPGRDTRASRRTVAGFSPDVVLESFGVSPDGATLTVNAGEDTTTLLLAEGVEGIEARPAPRGGR